jgi:hypothetical protein
MSHLCGSKHLAETWFGTMLAGLSVPLTVLRKHPIRMLVGALGALLLVMMAATPATANRPAPTGRFTEAIIEITFSDTTDASHTITMPNLALAGGELKQWFALASYGKLDFEVKTARTTLSNTRAYYQGHCENDTNPVVLDRCGDYLTAAVNAVKATQPTFFGDVNGISVLVPEISHLDGEFSWNPMDVGIGRNVQRSYLKEMVTPASSSLGPSQVEWGPWAHEFGHQLQYVAGLDLGGWMGHPSGYSSGYDLMDSCYPCDEAPYGLLGEPFVNDNRGSFEQWLDPSHVATVPAPGSGSPIARTFTLTPLEETIHTPVIQVIRVPIDSQRYYMVDARTRQASDHVGTTNRLYDEGVQIEYVDESRATPMTQCAPPATGSCVKDPPGGRWPYNLWHVGQTFTDTSRNIAIRVVAIVGSPSDPGRGFTVTVNRGVPPGHPQLYIIPWLTSPANSYETVDIWVDSSCNGYEADGYALRYGRRSDGTVVDSGDDPCLNHPNRVYANVHNIGDAASSPTTVHFQVSTPLGVGVTGAWTTIGDVPLPAIPAGGTATVYATWRPTATLTPAQIAAEHLAFHSCIQVQISSSTGEIVTSGHDAQENINTFEARVDPPLSARAGVIVHVPPIRRTFYISNDSKNFFESDPHRIYTFAVQSQLPPAWRYHIAGDAGQVFLGQGEVRSIPVKIDTGDAQAGFIYKLQVAGITYHWLYNIHVPTTSPEYRHFAVGPQSGVALQAHVVFSSQLTLTVARQTPAQIDIQGKLTAPHNGAPINIDYVSPSGTVTSHLVKSNAAGAYHDTLAQPRAGTWQIRSLWQGNMLWSSAVSNPVIVTVGKGSTSSPTSTATPAPAATATPPLPTGTATIAPPSPTPVLPTVTSTPTPLLPTVTSTPTPVLPTVTSTPTPLLPTATATAMVVPPAITNVTASPDPVFYGQCASQPTTLTVQAQVDSSAGISTVTLQYRYVSGNANVPPGPYRKAGMSVLKGDVFNTIVDVAKEGYGDLQGTNGTVEYQVLAVDAAKNMSSSKVQTVQAQYCLG